MNPNSDKPILFEVFTEMSTDAKVLHEYYESNITESEKFYHNAKKIAKNVLGEKGIQAVRKILNK